jgi:hypothetical protein
MGKLGLNSGYIGSDQRITTNGVVGYDKYYLERANGRFNPVLEEDPDAEAFFQRVVTAGGTLSATERLAVIQLVLDLKSYAIWNKMKAIYPMVGASAEACAQNLKSSSFTGTFTSGWTFANTGVKGNGSSTYMDTSLTPIGSLFQNSTHLSFYSRTTGSIANQFVEMGSYSSGGDLNATYMVTSYSSTIYPNLNSVESAGGSTPYANRLGFKMFNRVDSSNVRVFNNGTFLQSYARTSTTLNNLSLYVGAYHRDDSTIFSNDLECAFSSIGDGLTDTEASNFYTAVQAFQETLSRQV